MKFADLTIQSANEVQADLDQVKILSELKFYRDSYNHLLRNLEITADHCARGKSQTLIIGNIKLVVSEQEAKSAPAEAQDAG